MATESTVGAHSGTQTDEHPQQPARERPSFFKHLVDAILRFVLFAIGTGFLLAVVFGAFQSGDMSSGTAILLGLLIIWGCFDIVTERRPFAAFLASVFLWHLWIDGAPAPSWHDRNAVFLFVAYLTLIFLIGPIMGWVQRLSPPPGRGT